MGSLVLIFFNVFGIETQNADTPADITADTPVSFTSSGQQEVLARPFSLSQNNSVGENMRLRMKCQDQEEKLARQEVELKCAKRKASYKSENLAKIGKRMHAAKEEGVASDNVKIRVTKEHNFDGSRLFQSESAFLGKPGEKIQRLLQDT